MAERRFYIWLGRITLVSLAIRVGYVLVFRGGPEHLIGDAVFYHEGAKLIADGQGWVNPFYVQYFGIFEEAADHPPMYLAYLALVTLLGVDSITGHMLSSCLLGAAAVVLVGLAGRRLVGPRTGLIAAGLATVYPNVWSYDGTLLSETTAILMVAAFLLAAARYMDDATLLRAGVLGAVVGLAALARSELLLLSVIAVTPLVLSPRTGPWAERLRHLGAAGAACVLVLVPWVAHNLMRFEEPVLLSVGFEITLATANCDDTYYGDHLGYWSFECATRPLEERGISVHNTDQVGRSEVFWEVSTEYISEHQSRLPTVIAARLGRVTGLFRPVQQVDFDVVVDLRERWVAWSSLAMWYPIAIGTVVGAVVLRRRGTRVYPLLAPGLVVLAITVLTFGQNRYRASAEISFCLLAAVAVDAALRRWWDDGRRRARTSTDSVAASTERDG